MERYNKILKQYQTRKEDAIVKNYYSKEINKGKSYRAVYIDKIAIILIFFISSVAFFSSITKTLILPIYISLALVYFVTKALVSIRNKRLKIKIEKVNEDLKSKRILRELDQLNREEFINYVKAMLEKYYQNEFMFGEDGIDLIGDINNKKYAVKCIKSSQEDKVITKKVTEFNSYINYLNYDEGIIVTNSFFQDGIKEETSLILFDFMGIKEIIKSIGDYPSDSEIRSHINHRFEDRRKALREQVKVVNVRKIIKLYGVFIIFYSLSFFVKYGLYYRIMAILAFILATVLGGLKITEQVKLRDKVPLHK